LRIALPGVQVLFAFLLAVPFQQGFGDVTEFQKTVYFITLLLTALSTGLFIAPTAFHRLTFRLQQKERLVQTGNKLAIAGVACLGLAMTGAVTLITDVLYGAIATGITTTLILLMFVSLWVLLPLHGRNEAEKDDA
jgi:high-affinity Fe2+/Pb2+ permease